MFGVHPKLLLLQVSGILLHLLMIFPIVLDYFLMKSRIELFSIFQKFFVEICNQFHTSICILHCDNALEYLSTPFSTHLINRVPSFVLGDQVPHSLIFPNQPLFCLPLLVFRCTCFVHILTLDKDKLSAKATKCNFFGYSSLQCGYRCYSPDAY